MSEHDPVDRLHEDLLNEIGGNFFQPPFSIAHDSAGWWSVTNAKGKSVWLGGSRERAEERKAEFERLYGSK